MDDRVVQFRVGVMVLASLLIVGILLLLFGESPRFVKRIFQPTYTVRLWFQEAQGLSEDSLVRRNGILVGRVTKVGFAVDEAPLVRKNGAVLRKVRFAGDENDTPLPKDIATTEYETGVIVTAEIRQGATLFTRDVCRIETDLLGKHWIQFASAPLEGRPAAPQRLDLKSAQPHFLRGQMAPDPMDSIGMVTETLDKLVPEIYKVSASMTNAGNAIDGAARQVTDLLEDESDQGIRSAIEEANKSLKSLQRMFGSEKQKGSLEVTLEEVSETIKQFETTMKTANQRLDELKPLTQKLGSQETIAGLDRATRNLDQVMQDMAAFSKTLRNPQGSLGLLLQDRELYDHLNNVAENVDDLSRQLQPILDDVRIFTDKAARHPERLGVRGALQRYPGIK